MKPGLFSTPRRRTLLLAAVAVLAGLFFLWPRGPREPVYQGKTFTQWNNEVNTTTNGRVRFEAFAAVNAIGTNAVPFLLKDFTRSISPWRQRFNAWAGKHPSIKFRLRDDWKLIFAAASGLMDLRTNAAPALPVVARYLEDPGRGFFALMIFHRAGDGAVPYIAAAMSSTNLVVVSNTLTDFLLTGAGSAAQREACAAALRHPHAGVRVSGVKSWSAAMGARENVVPDLVKMVNDPSPLVVQEVSNQLARLSVQARPEIRAAASNALLTLRPNAPPPRAPGP